MALRLWRHSLRANLDAVGRHIEAAWRGLPQDPLAPLRRQALELLHGLAQAEPGSGEICRLGRLLRNWGDLCHSHAPARAQQLYERAWACGSDQRLDQQLANLYARQGMAEGAWALAQPCADLPPWPTLRCAGLHCTPCQVSVKADPLGQREPPPHIHELARGRIWLEINATFGETHGLAVASGSGQLQPDLCRRYPWHWPACPYQRPQQRDALLQLAGSAPQPCLQVEGPVLAVAELSGELYYHGQLELLPRLGRAWQQLAPHHPNLQLWHNGGRNSWLQEALRLIGIPPHQQIDGHRHPHLQATTLFIPGFTSAFGHPGLTTLSWLRKFWGAAVDALPSKPMHPQPRALLLARPPNQRRPLLQHEDWVRQLTHQGFAVADSHNTVTQQLRSLQRCEQVVAVHGGAMANLLLLPSGAQLQELANPAYSPPYFASLIASGRLQHSLQLGASTPQVLQDLLYAGPLEWPIDLPP